MIEGWRGLSVDRNLLNKASEQGKVPRLYMLASYVDSVVLERRVWRVQTKDGLDSNQ